MTSNLDDWLLNATHADDAKETLTHCMSELVGKRFIAIEDLSSEEIDEEDLPLEPSSDLLKNPKGYVTS